METVLILLWQKIQAGAIRRLLIWRIDAKWFNEKGHLRTSPAYYGAIVCTFTLWEVSHWCVSKISMR